MLGKLILGIIVAGLVFLAFYAILGRPLRRKVVAEVDPAPPVDRTNAEDLQRYRRELQEKCEKLTNAREITALKSKIAETETELKTLGY